MVDVSLTAPHRYFAEADGFVCKPLPTLLAPPGFKRLSYIGGRASDERIRNSFHLHLKPNCLVGVLSKAHPAFQGDGN